MEKRRVENLIKLNDQVVSVQTHLDKNCASNFCNNVPADPNWNNSYNVLFELKKKKYWN